MTAKNRLSAPRLNKTFFSFVALIDLICTSRVAISVLAAYPPAHLARFLIYSETFQLLLMA
jgi:hypothetical protein